MSPGDGTPRYMPLFPYLRYWLATLGWLTAVILMMVAAAIVAWDRPEGRVAED
jgi:hypothetical protein